MMLEALLLATLVELMAAEFDPELHAKYMTMPKSSFIEYFNAQDYSYKIAEFENKYTGCAHVDKESMERLPIQTHDLDGIDLPESFDAREKWPQCEFIKEVYDQGACGSCWTFGTATTASDRTCIHKDLHVQLSEQDFECLQTNVCGGGYPVLAFQFWQDKGLVTQECKPYNIDDLIKNKCETKCVNTDVEYNEDKHYAEKVYRISNNSDEIKAELVKNGPIQAAFTVFGDFTEYKSGIYIHTHGYEVGRHSVRIIGYGVEDGKDYWLVANSWGEIWGEHGFFKIKSYQEGIEFENDLLAGIPKN
ncbi:hypothetical protein PYW07_008880 [Mythimna separata]|uniref:Peptidase C1A papain C-terminal domain-containing protein n=1 Tax=Mythimna separata TaxID=271217 RepID=A0AAD7YAW9_MYTSE|nr:hypothetical protein PYW07_008880 [Mythimna separata]